MYDMDIMNALDSLTGPPDNEILLDNQPLEVADVNQATAIASAPGKNLKVHRSWGQ